MKTRMIIIVGALALIVGLLILNFTGILPWQKIAIIFAAIVAPLRHLATWLKGSTEKINEVQVAHAKARKMEDTFRKDNEAEIARDKVKLETINTEIKAVNSQKDSLEVQRLEANEILKNLSDEELLKAMRKTLGQK